MSRRKNYKVNAHKLHSVIQHLQLLERKNSKLSINGEPLSELLIEHSDYIPPVESVPNATKIAILRTAGVVEPPPINPNRLRTDKKMSRLNFTDADYIILAKRLTVIIGLYHPSERITADEISECDLIQDCIDLVVAKCNS